MFIFMVFIFLLLFIGAFFIFKKELFAPAIIVSVMYCVSGLCALYNYSKWGLENYSYKTASIVILGLVTFLITSLVVWIINKEINIKSLYTLNKGKNKNKKDEKINKNKITNKGSFFENKDDKIRDINRDDEIKLPNYIGYIFLGILIFTIAYRIMDIFKVNGLYGNASNFSKMIGSYRSIISYSSKGIVYSPPFILKQLDKLVTVIAYINTFICIKNLVNDGKIKKNITYIIYFILFVIYSVICGGRMPILKLIAATIFFYYCLSNFKYGWNNSKIRRKLILLVTGIFIGIIILFPALHNVLGRNRSFTGDYYITMYAGGPLKLFDMYLNDPIDDSDIFGKETFYGINQALAKIGIKNTETYIKHLEFRTYNKLFLGNVYTPFRRYYADFGIVGVVVLTAIFSLIMNYLYLKVKKRIVNNMNKDIWIISYGIIIYTLFLYSIDDQFYPVICSTSYIAYYLILFAIYAIYNIYKNKHIKIVDKNSEKENGK